jgi:hypothetical protein
MTGRDVLLALAGAIVTVLVIPGMILITPREQVDLHADGADPQGSNLSRAEAPTRPAALTGS